MSRHRSGKDRFSRLVTISLLSRPVSATQLILGINSKAQQPRELLPRDVEHVRFGRVIRFGLLYYKKELPHLTRFISWRSCKSSDTEIPQREASVLISDGT
jgi:hypothetical protein